MNIINALTEKIHSAISGNLTKAAAFLMALCMITASVPLAADAEVLNPFQTQDTQATTIRLAKTEGSVMLTNSAGKAVFKQANMRLTNGTHIETGEASYSWFDLDETKAIKEDAVSEVELRENGKKLEVMLNSGNLFFNITRPLTSDESLNIRTSSMVMGIRGTCGWVEIIDGRTTRVYMLEGRAEVSVTNPITCQTKTTVLYAGETADFIVYDPANPVDQCDIIINRFTREDVPGFVLKELVGDTKLLQKIYDESGIDLRDLTAEEADERIKQDQQRMSEILDVIKKSEDAQENHISLDPVWERKRNEEDNSSEKTTTPSRTLTLTMKVTAQEVQDYLNSGNYDQVILNPGNGTDNTLDIDIPMTVPEGTTLTANPGVPVNVRAGNSLTVNGTADLGDEVTNNGTITVNSSNTLKVSGMLTNTGTFNNTSKGRTVASGGYTGRNGSVFMNSGVFSGSVQGQGAVRITGGTVSGNLSAASGTSTISGGTVSGDLEISGGTCTISGGTVSGGLKLSDGTCTISGGTVSGDLEISGGTGTISGGTAGGSVTLLGGTLTISRAFDNTIVFGGGTLDLSGGTLGGTVSGSGGGQLKLSEGTLGGRLTGMFDSIEINGGTFGADLSGVDVTDLTVTGGTMNALTPASVGSFTITGGAVNGRVVLNEVTWVSIEGGSITYSGTEAALEINTDSLDTVFLEGGTITNNGAGFVLATGTSGGTLSYDGGTVLRTGTTEQPTDIVLPGWILIPDGDGYKLSPEPAFEIIVTGAGENDLDDISTTVYAAGEVSDTAKQDENVMVMLYNTGTADRTFSYTVSETVRGNVFSQGDIIIAAGDQNTDIDFSMIYADVTVTITDTTPGNRAAANNAAADNAYPAVNRKKAAASAGKETVTADSEDDTRSDPSGAETKSEKRSSDPATASNYTD
ncbi:MAG: hypothetical protein IKE56_00635 [Lachnospiraceae bacterium]|nr:hypothetical protein [Lachnospiraceae bacterium]